MATRKGHWWYDLITAGTTGTTYVQYLHGSVEGWDRWPVIRKANPLTSISQPFRAKLIAERAEARKDSRLKARFLSYRLNVPSQDESEMLLSVDDWLRMTAREVPERSGKPLVGIDLAAGRAWSAAVACWESGRIEALALCPGIPSVEDQERRDGVPPGAYQSLVDTGVLQVAEGLRVQTAAALWDAIRDAWGVPVNIICDWFRLADLQDAVRGDTRIEPRITRWSDSSADIRALRKGVKDGPLSVEKGSRGLLAESLRAAMVKHDDSGNSRLIKRGSNNQARDDVSAAFALVGGAFERASGGSQELVYLVAG